MGYRLGMIGFFAQLMNHLLRSLPIGQICSTAEMEQCLRFFTDHVPQELQTQPVADSNDPAEVEEQTIAILKQFME